MSVEDCKRLIESAADYAMSPWSLCLTGGEFLVYPTQALELIDFATKRQAIVSITTNAAWAINKDKADRTAEMLARSGLAAAALSISDFHTSFIPPKAVVFAAHALNNSGVSIIVKYAATRSRRIWHYLEELAAEGLEFPFFTRFEEFPVLRSGRGKNLQSSAFINRKSLPSGKCPAAALTVNYDGRMVPCCNGGGDLPALQSADIRGLTFSEFVSRFQNNVVYQYLVENGPAATLDFLPRDAADRARSLDFVDECDLCIHVFSEIESAKIITEAITQRRDD